ncbi:hypothetical protein PUNSTDRAFT_46575 [Punctularia strigosozonata HHB-11173 SS5]|uniref:uncharacterized protein n=1 Tax=Punctularia strigosozonata (strain HHB-11173) TaxID=741275 RepID=UPI0004417044|nr:uncharacterized protein PUNSTDRAFT_46575 [Punctularia strigosozonata HHB-11173 SS5]EIN05702.1 hypothetical protein PUNSTDRAFT_46575 [Punctularia strigosozonata HHB-11173 SS5]
MIMGSRRASAAAAAARREGQGKKKKRDDDNPFEIGKFDDDDPQFVDEPVFVEVNFTGSALYVFAVLPLGLSHTNSTPTFTNLTFTLDAAPYPLATFAHSGSAYATGFLAQAVLALPSLPSDSAHTLRIDVGPDSVFLLDSVVYTAATRGEGGKQVTPPSGLAANQTAPSPSPSASAMSTSPSPAKPHNIATFAGAVGGAIGFLALAALCIAASIIRRRARARKRDRQWARDHAGEPDGASTSNHTSTSFSAAPGPAAPRTTTPAGAGAGAGAGVGGRAMSGPVPFVPRYFPGTVPAAPPPYAESARPSSARSPPPLITLLSPDLRPQRDGDRDGDSISLAPSEQLPSYLEHTASPRIRPSDIPLLDMAALAGAGGAGARSSTATQQQRQPDDDDEFDYGLHGLNVPPAPAAHAAIAELPPARPRPPPTPLPRRADGEESRGSTNWLARWRRGSGGGGGGGSGSLPHPRVAEADGLMENEEGAEEVDSLHGI